MLPPQAGDVTVILKRWDSDRQSSIQALTPIVYGELRKIAAAYLRRQRPDHTLQPTALIHEAYLRLVTADMANVQDRAHFFTLAARMMRQILVDAARAHQSAKRGAGNKIQLDGQMEIGNTNQGMDFLALHEALENLQSFNARLAEAVELRYFGGLELDEIAESLCVSLATAKRDLTLGKAWLRRKLSPLAE